MNNIKPIQTPIEQGVKIYRVLFILIMCLLIGQGILLYRASYGDKNVTIEQKEAIIYDELSSK